MWRMGNEERTYQKNDSVESEAWGWGAEGRTRLSHDSVETRARRVKYMGTD